MTELAAPLRSALEAIGHLAQGRPAAESVAIAGAEGAASVKSSVCSRQPSCEPKDW